MSLNRDPEYIRFLNLIARTYMLPFNFDNYDELPLTLQTTYKAYAWTKYYEIDISAAQFGAVVPDEEVDVLRGFCNETSDFIETLVHSISPTSAPTPVPTTTSPVLPAPTFPPLSFDVETANTMVMSESASISDLPIQCRRAMFGSDSERDGFLLPEEYTMFANRMSSNAYLQAGSFDALPLELQENFHNLADEGRIDIFGAIPSQWSQATPQQRAFLQLVCFRTEGALVKAHEAKEQHNNQTVTHTATPTTVSPTTLLPANNTVAPTPFQTTNANANNTNSTTNPPNTTIANGNASNNNSHPGFEEGKRKRNVIAAIVGSILIVMLGLYLARDKQDRLKEFASNVYSRLKKRVQEAHKQHQRRQSQRRQNNAKISPALSTDTDDVKSNNGGYRHHPHPDFRRRHEIYDVESLQHERTGFLEDQRIGTENVVLQVGDEVEADHDAHDMKPHIRQSDGSSSLGFKTVRVNPEEFTTRPYGRKTFSMRFDPDDEIPDERDNTRDVEENTNYATHVHQLDHHDIDLGTEEETHINEDFRDYRFDDLESDSSAMSLYCSSVADEGSRAKARNQIPNRAKKQIGKKKKKVTIDVDNSEEPIVDTIPRRGSRLNQEPRAETISSPRRGSNTMYPANRFGPNAPSESKSDSGQHGHLRGHSVPCLSPRARRQISARKGTLGGSSHHQRDENQQNRNRRQSGSSRQKPLRTAARPTPAKRTSAKNPKRRSLKKAPSVSSLEEPSEQAKELSVASKADNQKESTVPQSPEKATVKKTFTRQQKKHSPTPSRTVHFEEVELEKPVDRFLRYAMDESSTESSDASESTHDHDHDHDEGSSRSNTTPLQAKMEDELELPERHRTIAIDVALSDEEETSLTEMSRQGSLERSRDSPPVSPRQENKKVTHRCEPKDFGGKDRHNSSLVETRRHASLSPAQTRPTQAQSEKKVNDPMKEKSTNTMRSAFMRAILGDSSGDSTPKTKSQPANEKGKVINVDCKTIDMEKRPLMEVDTMSFSSDSASFHPHSPVNSITKGLVRGDSDSTYYGNASETSSTFPPESSTSESFALPEDESGTAANDSTQPSTKAATKDPIAEIRELVAIVMPTEQEKITHMLDQYKGREIVLLQTLRRLEARSSARRRRGSTVYAAKSTTDPKRSSLDTAKEALRRSSVVTENAELLAASATAVAASPTLAEGSERSEKTAMLDLETSSEGGLEEDEFSLDSTYVDDDMKRSSGSILGDDDGSWSVFSGGVRFAV
ncbi:expressed unknown protein [Seminavis robusta]|uniref:Uncharacterized protein n=1 Tax=Seminavis robusta TaxID=568900 RepID=A0A9N8E9K7_9STRA|nr:expressed unknown protein [Seminavis robusta]|eukprot:Sro659_g182900.1 n/a (1246) ;mRNA; r:16854-20591